MAGLTYIREMFRSRLIAALLVVLPPGAALAQETAAGGVHVVAAGETVSAIAAHYGVTVEQLVDHNEGLEPDRIRVGQRLLLGGERRFHGYRVQEGETLSGIAKRHDVSLAELQRWNPQLRPDHIRIGQTIRIYSKKPTSHSQSVGSPSRGALKAARRLPRHPAYVIRERGRAWATDETIRGIVKAFDHVRSRHPKAARLKVHDLSLRRGGPMTDHRSHQSGRDADIAYFQRGCASRLCEFRRLKPSELDTDRTWTLLEYWLERDMLEAVFIDYRLQAPLYRHARARGASASQLSRWFQYPRGRTHPLGVVRHFPKHADHMHVRFACHQSDPECKTFRPLLTQHATR